MNKCEQCGKEFNYESEEIDDMDNPLKTLKVCMECDDAYQDALYYSEFSE